MEFLKNKYNSIVEYLSGDKNSIEQKNFYLVMLASMPVYIILCLVFLFIHLDSSVIYFCLLIMFFIVCLSYAARITKQEHFFGMLYCFALNFLIDPIFFLMIGDIYNGAAIFFALGIIVTVFLNSKDKTYIFIVALEIIWDIALVIFVYFNKESFVLYRINSNTSESIAVCFAIASVALTYLCIYQAFIYRVAREKLDDASKDISIAQSSRTRFLANMTHEIRTPMNAIIGMTNLILKEDLHDVARDQANIIHNASTDLLRIINDILEFSKLDSGKVELVNSEYSFKNFLSEIINSVAGEYDRLNIVFPVFARRTIPDNLFGDSVRIRQVFKYILFSTLSQQPYGSVFMNIDYDIDDSDNIITIFCKIAANGPGFSKSELDAMFNAYSNYDSRQKSKFIGTGLELNICKSILHLMGGDLTVESIEGVGTSIEFYFKNYVVGTSTIGTTKVDNFKPLVYLPNKQVEEAWYSVMNDFEVPAHYVRNVSSFKKALEETKFSHIFFGSAVYPELKGIIESAECEEITYVICSVDNAYGDFGNCRVIRKPVYSVNLTEVIEGTWDPEKYKRKEREVKITYPEARVLVVDDSIINIKVEESLLANFDIKSVNASGGREALDLLKREDFDLVLLDQKMPDFDGIQTIHALRESDYMTKDIPVICVTAEFGADTKEKLCNEGFNDYLAKPINLKYFDRILKELLPKELQVAKVVTDDDKVKARKPGIRRTQEKVVENANNGPTEEEIVEFKPDEGIKNLGGSMEAYLAVLSAYYKEGVDKLVDVPKQFAEGDISLYTTNVHALKSSSATVGALGISPLFKALEFAGKDNNVDFIKENSEKTFTYLTVVLDKVKAYLIEQNAFEEEAVLEEDEVDEESSAKDELDVNLLTELNGCISTMNLRRSEEIINELMSKNFGKEINNKVKAMHENYENFEYMEIKDIISSLIS